MKLTIEKQELAHGLATVVSIIEKRNTLPILANVLIDAAGDRITLTATDLDIEATVVLTAEVEVLGSCTVNADLVNNMVKKLPSGKPITLVEDGGKLTVKSGRARSSLATLPAKDFPILASDDFTAEFEMQANDLNRILSKTSFAMSTEETRYYLNGVYFHTVDGVVTAVATDGHKLARATVDQSEEFPSVIIPRKTVTALSKALSEGVVTVSVSDTKIKFDMGDEVFLSKVIDGTFPEYSRIIPDNLKDKFTVNAREFGAASSYVATVSEDKVRRVGLEVSDDTVELSVNGPNNSATDVVSAEVSGGHGHVHFNSKYLAEALAQSDGGDVVFWYDAVNPTSPALIKTTNDDNFLAVIMPMR